MAVHALTFLMTINPRTMLGCATTISDNTFADRRERERASERATPTESASRERHDAHSRVRVYTRTRSRALLLALTYAPLARAYRALRM